MKEIKYCEHCGGKLVFKKFFHGFDRTTGKKMYNVYGKCSNYVWGKTEDYRTYEYELHTSALVGFGLTKFRIFILFGRVPDAEESEDE